MFKTKEDLILTEFDLHLIVGVWEHYLQNKSFSSFDGAKKFFKNSDEEINKHYDGIANRFWSAKTNTAKHKLNVLVENYVLRKIENGKRYSYVPNKNKCVIKVSRFPDGKENKDYVCVKDMKNKWLIFQI